MEEVGRIIHRILSRKLVISVDAANRGLDRWLTLDGIGWRRVVLIVMMRDILYSKLYVYSVAIICLLDVVYVSEL